MIPRNVLVVLVYGLAVSTVSFAVLAGGALLLGQAGDQVGAAVLGRLAAAALILLIIDLVLLVGSLGINAVAGSDDRSSGGS